MGSKKNKRFITRPTNPRSDDSAALPSKTRTGRPTADQIGDTGERLVDDWACRSGMRSAQLNPDRLGVDKIVEWEPEVELPNDARHDHVPCRFVAHLQVKAAVDRCPSQSISFANWHRYIHSDVPVFVVGLQLTRELELDDVWILHVDERVIGRVMKAMRSKPVSANCNVGLIPPWSLASRLPIENVAAEFRKSLSHVIGDPASYAKGKSSWRRTVGYGPGDGFRISVRINADSDALVAASLGDIELPAEVTGIMESRFGISLPAKNPAMSGPVRLRFAPKDLGSAVLQMTSRSGVENVGGRLAMGARMSPNGVALKFKSGLLEMRVIANQTLGAARLSLSHLGIDSPMQPFSYGTGLAAARVFNMLAEGEGEIRLLQDGAELARAETRGVSLDRSAETANRLYEWVKIPLDNAGISIDERVFFRLVESQAQDLAYWAAFFRPETVPDVALVLGGVDHSGGPVVVVLIAVFATLRGIVAQPLVFGDPEPRLDGDGSLVIRPRPVTSGAAKFVRLDNARSVNPIDLCVSIPTDLRDRGELLMPSEDEMRAQWKRRIREVQKANRHLTAGANAPRRS